MAYPFMLWFSTSITLIGSFQYGAPRAALFQQRELSLEIIHFNNLCTMHMYAFSYFSARREPARVATYDIAPAEP